MDLYVPIENGGILQPTRILITKAAAISSAMLARKQSYKGAESYAADNTLDNEKETTNLNWFQRSASKTAIITCCLLSLLSVSANTPTTFESFPPLQIITYVIDMFTTLLFTIEAAVKMKQKGVVKKSTSYFHDRWCQFDFFMLIFHWISVITQTVELLLHIFPIYFRSAEYGGKIRLIGLVRAFRPLILLRIIRSLLKVQLPRNRISQIFKRSSQQVYNVTIFFLFFMSLYAILGVQFFGRMDYHCVRNNTDLRNLTIRDLAIPDTYCSPDLSGYQCPKGMRCVRLKLTDSSEGYYGMFNDFAHSVFSVYMAASQEGWVYVMYDCIDSLPSWKAFIYFTTLIFFLAWLVKNVFIAVITETFAEIRVQFSQMWGNREMVTDVEIRHVLEKADENWKFVALDAKMSKGWAPKICIDFYNSTSFKILTMILVLANALAHASFVHRHDDTDVKRKEIIYYIECAFTFIFNIECLFKMWCLGWHGYISPSLHKFEVILCIGSTLNIIKPLYDMNVFTYCQVFRVLRLIKASPMLEDFVYKIFGPGKKLGGIILFTVALLILTSSISLQLFCFVNNLDRFRTLPQAIMSMFQIMTQEEWTEVVVETMRSVGETLAPLVAIYFVTYHLLVTLIVLSLFVAVILDNLEMDEELKKVKQLKAREHTTSCRTNLPLRLRVFTHFPDRPQMVIIKRIPSEFPLPKIRDSFTKLYATEEQDFEEDRELSRLSAQKIVCKPFKELRVRKRAKLRQMGHLSSIMGVTCVINESNKTRMLLSDSFGILPVFNRSTNRKTSSIDARTVKSTKSQLSLGGVKLKQLYQHVKENGDLFNADEYSESKEQAQGEIDIKAIQQKKRQAEMARSRLQEEMRENHPFFDKPLFVFDRENKIRKICQVIVYAKYLPLKTDPATQKPLQLKYQEIHELLGMMTYLDWTMFFLTILSCISMLFEKPWPLDGRHLIMNNGYLQIAEYVFVIGMTFELVLKVLANGLFFTPKAVIRDAGGVLTAFIYATSLIFLVWMPKSIKPNSAAQLIMVFRAMRPLRIYTLVPHIRRVVVELFRGFREILLVTILLIVLMFIFASYGVQIAGGKLTRCNDDTIKSREDCVGHFYQYVHVTKLQIAGQGNPDIHPKWLVPRVWANPRNFNFDHIGNAMLALFEILSFKGWTVMRDVILGRLGAWAAIFIHLYVFIGCMIGLTLFVGVVIANYSENRGTALLTVDQRRWNDLKNRLKMAQPYFIPPRPPESSRMRKFMYDMSMSLHFKRFFIVCVLLNSMLLFVPWSVEEEEHQDTKNTLKALIALSAVFTLIFFIEIICKVFAFTFRGFWQNFRNRIDLVITILGLAWCLLHFFVALPTEKKNLREVTYMFGYAIVVMRFFTIVGRHSTLKMLMLTVVMSMFRSFFIIMAMFLLMLFYAYAGVILFGMVKYGQAVNRHANFRSSTNALTVLFRIVTGEDWNEIMHDCMRSPPYCWYYEGASLWQTDCGNYHGAVFYFCSFYLTITYIVLNLLVAIIMENFSLFYSSEEDALLSYADIRNFQNVWNIVDKDQKGSIPVRRVKFLLHLLKGRLEVDPEKDRLLFKHMCYEMEQLRNSEEVSFHDVLSMLSYRSVDIRKHLQLEELVQREELEYLIEEDVAKFTIRAWLEKCIRRMRQKEQNFSILKTANINLTETVEPVAEINRVEPPKVAAVIKPIHRGSVGSVIAETTKTLVSTVKASHDRQVGRTSSIMLRPNALSDVAESIEESKVEHSPVHPKSIYHANAVNPYPTTKMMSYEPEYSADFTDVKNWWKEAIEIL